MPIHVALYSETAAVPSPGDDLTQFALLLDIDGTILDLAPTPDEVVVTDSLRHVLTGLFEQTRGALALVSGRALADIDHIFAPLRLPAIGGHGAELRPVVHEGTSRAAGELDFDLRTRLAAVAALDPGIMIEDKGYALALHYRRAPDKQQAVEAAVQAICAQLPERLFEILPGKAVLEIKARGFNKGAGIRKLMQVPPFAGRRPVFVGDDVTDESAVAVLPDFNGIGLSVGRALPGVMGRFARPQDVRHWLARLCEGDEVARR